MATFTSFANYGDRFEQLVRQYRADLLESVIGGMRDLAHSLASESPVDTSRLLSNFLLGSDVYDITYRRAWVEGKGGSTRNGSLAALAAFNKQRGDREFSRAIGNPSKTRVRLVVGNKTPYLKYAEKLTRPYLQRVSDAGIAEARRRYNSVRLGG